MVKTSHSPSISEVEYLDSVLRGPLSHAPKLGTFVPRMGTLLGKTGLSDALFSKTQQALLGLFFANVDESYHLREIVRKSNVGQGTVQRTLAKLSEAGIIEREQRGRQTFYSANRECSIFADLHRLVIKTIGVAKQLAEKLKTLEDKISIAFIYGSFARGDETGKSDIDLLVIGKIKLSDVVKVMSGLQPTLAREINPTVFEPEEYRQKLNQGHHFLTSLLKEPRIFLIGDEDAFKRMG